MQINIERGLERHRRKHMPTDRLGTRNIPVEGEIWRVREKERAYE